jgi:hypothetical protein
VSATGYSCRGLSANIRRTDFALGSSIRCVAAEKTQNKWINPEVWKGAPPRFFLFYDTAT